MISISFQFETEHGTFADAIVLTEEEHSSFTEEQIETIKLQRLNDWLKLYEQPVEDQ